MRSTETLTRAAIAEAIHSKLGLSRAESLALVESILTHMCEALSSGENVKISGFGNFQIRMKAPRPGRNPRTGEAIPIGERRVATFQASAKLKEQIQNGGGAEEASDTGSTEIEVWRVGAE